MTENDENLHYEGPRRRGNDAVVDLLRDRIDGVSEESHATRSALENHVTSCAKQQQKVLWAIIGTFGWVVAHSPEVVGFMGKIAAVVK